MKERIINEWFQSWLDSKWSNFQVIFAPNIYYSESFGLEYRGIDELKIWVSKWHNHSHLNELKIKNITHIGNSSFVEWYFNYSDKDGKHELDGISVIEWSINGKIKVVKEFASSLPKYDPIKTIETINDRKYPYGCKVLKYSDLNKNCALSEVCKFNKEDILNDENKKKIFSEIHKECYENNAWALLGGILDDEFICLQVASASNISKEIIADIKCMLPLDKNDTKSWNSKFHDNVFTVQYGWDVRCQKYRDMYARFKKFCIISIDPKIYLKNTDIGEYNLVKYTEVKYAYDTLALYWNPIKEEHKILRDVEEKQICKI